MSQRDIQEQVRGLVKDLLLDSEKPEEISYALSQISMELGLQRAPMSAAACNVVFRGITDAMATYESVAEQQAEDSLDQGDVDSEANQQYENANGNVFLLNPKNARIH